MTIRHDLSTTLLPYPLQVHDNEQSIIDGDELGALLVRQNVSLQSSASPRDIGRLHVPNPARMFTPTNGIDAAHEAIIRWRGENEIIRLTPDDGALHAYDGVTTDIGLLNGFRVPIETLLQQNKRATLVMSSPNGISGQIATLQEAVRLARHFRLIVIDERLAAFSLRRLDPLLLEWENIVFVQRFPFIMPGQSHEFGWILHPAALREQIIQHADPVVEESINEALRYGGINTFMAARRTARHKSQLYRELRKLSIVSVPYPTWSNSLLARVERGNRDEIVTRLADRGIAVYAPPHENLRQHFRVTAVSDNATIALRDALIEINREL